MNTHMWEERLLSRGIVDTHFHVGPEFIDRMYDVYTLAEIARDRNITLVLKNHTYPTTPLAALAGAADEANCAPTVTVAASVRPRSAVIVKPRTNAPLLGATTVATAVLAPNIAGGAPGALRTVH